MKDSLDLCFSFSELVFPTERQRRRFMPRLKMVLIMIVLMTGCMVSQKAPAKRVTTPQARHPQPLPVTSSPRFPPQASGCNCSCRTATAPVQPYPMIPGAAWSQSYRSRTTKKKAFTTLGTPKPSTNQAPRKSTFPQKGR